MVMAVISPAPQGHCSRCGKVWTLETGQGVCQWCGKPASCNSTTSKPRHIKSRSNRRRKQANGNGNGYDHLQGAWLTYYKVALPFANSVPDREDLLHTIIANLADAGRNNGHKPDNQSWMYRIASFTKAQYWREHYKHTNGLTCGNCSTKQRRKCKEDWLYGKCPKLVKIESLNKPIVDGEGNMSELGNLIADDKALDISQWLEINEQLLHTPDRALAIAGKIQDGETLTNQEHQYLWRFRHKTQKSLF